MIRSDRLRLPRLARLCAAFALAGLAGAAPRVGNHDGYTRLVFDLPADASHSVIPTTSGVSVKLDVKLPPENGRVSSPNVTKYDLSASDTGSKLQLAVTSGRKVKVFVLPASADAPARLVVDVGPEVDGVPIGKPLTAQSAAASLEASKATAASKAPNRPRLQVVIDAGHGGSDGGMVGYVVEKEVTLDLALRVRSRLQAHGIAVVLTRDRDTHLSLDKLTDLGMRANMANAGTVNAFLSIHVNAASASAQGIETWVFGEPLAASDRALAIRENGGGSLGERLTKEAGNMAQNLLGDLLAQSNVSYSRKLATLVQGNLIRNTGAVNRGVRTNSFYVIRKPRTPAILIEVGFGSHPVEGRKLATDEYRNRLADAIADAVVEFLNAP